MYLFFDVYSHGRRLDAGRTNSNSWSTRSPIGTPLTASAPDPLRRTTTSSMCWRCGVHTVILYTAVYICSLYWRYGTAYMQ